MATEDVRHEVGLQIAELEKHIVDLRSGRTTLREQSSSDGPWRDVTQQLLARHERTLDVYRRLLKALRFERAKGSRFKPIGGMLANGQASRFRKRQIETS